tara:strand:- start:7562 stop:7672 length:111 start_codon:yes stop_codon:yes gene_type:complete
MEKEKKDQLVKVTDPETGITTFVVKEPKNKPDSDSE